MRACKGNPAAGFTLIELLIALIVGAVLLAFALPSFLDLMQRTRIHSTAESILEAVRISRLTAAEERINVVICTRNTSDACGGNGDWGNGIIAYKDMDQNGTRSEDEDIILIERFNPKVTVINTRANDVKINIKSSGWTPGDQTTILVCNQDGTNNNSYRLVLNNAGRVKTEAYTAGAVWDDSCTG